MSVGLSLPQLNAIACGAIGVNGAAGGAAGYNLTGDYMPDLITIACQLRNANVALGGSGGGAGGFDSVGNLMVYITCQAQGLSSATGTGSAVPWQPYNMLQMWQAIDCALAQTITNTGGTAQGYSNATVYGLMEGAICLLNQIAEHGFVPPAPPPPPTNLIALSFNGSVELAWDDMGTTTYKVYRSLVNGGPYTFLGSNDPHNFYTDFTVVNGTVYYYVVTQIVNGLESGYSNQVVGTPRTALQQFIADLLVFAPDVLLVADTNAGGQGATVATWADQSGHGANAAHGSGAGATSPTLNLASINGRNSVLFNGTTSQLQGAYVNNSALMTLVVVFNNTVGANGPTFITTAASNGGGDASQARPIIAYCDSGVTPTLRIYLGTPGAVVNAPLNVFHLGASWFDGVNSFARVDATSSIPGLLLGAMTTTLYSIGQTSSIAGGRGLTGDIAFVALWKTDIGATNRNNFITLVQNYYGI